MNEWYPPRTALYEKRPVLGMKDGIWLIALQILMMLVVEFCVSRLVLREAEALILTACMSVGCYLLPVGFALSLRGASWRSVFGARGYSDLTLPVLMAFCTLFLCAGVQAFYLKFLEFLGLPIAESSVQLRAALPLQLLCMAVPSGICEEVMMRGVLLPAMERRVGRTAAIWGSALVFALMHGSVQSLVSTMIAGVLLALLTVRSGSILPAIVLHTIHNGLGVYIAWLQTQAAASAAEQAALQTAQAWPQLVMAGAMILCSVIVLWILYRAFCRRCRPSPRLHQEQTPIGISTGIAGWLAAALIGLRIGMNL